MCSDVESAELYELMQNPEIEEEVLLLWDKLHEDKSMDISAEESNRLYRRILSRWEMRDVLKANSQQLMWLRFRKVAAIAAVLLMCWGSYLIVFQSNSGEREAF